MPKKLSLSAADRRLAARMADLYLRRAHEAARGPRNAGVTRSRTEHYLKRIEHAKRNSIQVETLEKKGKLLAYFLVENDTAFYSKRIPWQKWHLDHDSRFPEARKWVETRIKENARKAPKNTEILLQADESALLRLLVRSGFYVESIGLKGRVRDGLAKLRKRHPRAFAPIPKGFSIKPLSNSKELDAILRIVRREFTRCPEHGWFLSHPDFLRDQRKYHLKQLRKKRRGREFSRTWVIYRGKRVVGQFAGFYSLADSSWGSQVGIDLCLAKEIQGLGFGLIAYATVLREAAQMKVKYFSGGTSHPVVLKLGREMGRWRYFIFMLKGKGHYPLKHFGLRG